MSLRTFTRTLINGTTIHIHVWIINNNLYMRRNGFEISFNSYIKFFSTDGHSTTWTLSLFRQNNIKKPNFTFRVFQSGSKWEIKIKRSKMVPLFCTLSIATSRAVPRSGNKPLIKCFIYVYTCMRPWHPLSLPSI